MDPADEQDKIRLKRIAKLQQRQAAEQAASAATASSTPTAGPSSSPSTSKPLPPVVPKPTPKPITVRPAAVSTPVTPTPRSALGATGFPDSFERWEHRVIQDVLDVTLDQRVAEKDGWTGKMWLKEVWEEQNSVDVNSELLDRLLLARLSLDPSTLGSLQDEADPDPIEIQVLMSLVSTGSLEYLTACWKRERTERNTVMVKKLRNGNAADEEERRKRLDVLGKIKALVVSYLGIVLMDPTMFPVQHLPSSHPLGPAAFLPLLLPASQPSPLPITTTDLPSLLTDLSARYTPSPSNDYESGFTDMIQPLFHSLARDLLFPVPLDIATPKPVQANHTWRDLISALMSLVEIKGVANALPDLDGWSLIPTDDDDGDADDQAAAAGDKAAKTNAAVEQLAGGGRRWETDTLIGPFARLSAFPDPFPLIGQSFFPDASTMGRGDVESASNSLRGTLRGVQDSIYQILSTIIKASPKSRAKTLDWLSGIAKSNYKRSAMQVDPKTVATNGFVINLHTVLLKLSEPFLDLGGDKMDKIDPSYFKYSDRIDIKEETKMSATQRESDEYYAKAEGAEIPAPHFISEIFFMCCQYLHIGTMHAIKDHKGLGQQLSHMKRQLDDLEADTTWRGTPNEAATQAHMDRYRKRREAFHADLYAMEVQLLDKDYLSKCVAFANLVMAWLVRMVDPKGKHPKVQISLPLPEETPQAFRFLPEYLIEDITEFLSFVSKYNPFVLAETSQDELITFMLVFLSTPYMKNPYLKGQFVEIMYYLTRPIPRYPRGSLGDVLNFNPIALTNLMPCLVHAYVQIEITGSHTQFYDKFNTRYYITQLFKLVWENPAHRHALQVESTHLDRYVRFVNLLMNDTTYLLDDAILHLGKIATIQKAMDDKAAWDAMPATERQEQEKLLRQYESSAKSDLDLGHESLRLLKLFAAETKEPFLTPEIVDRLAAMLDMNLSMLAGPRCQDLRVKEPEKYKFRPKELLSDVIQIFLELGTRTEFQEAVARDGRSYSKDLFERAGRIATRTAIKTEQELAGLRVMVDKVEAIKAAEEEEDAMGEVPDDYLDPLTYEIMRDPVLLPSSKTIVDRSTIKQHYLSDATDPFNRVPLKWEDVTDAVELREQITAFLAQRRANRKGVTAAAPLVEVSSAMEVDE